LVGDTAYFGELGFSLASNVTMPGPVDPRRVLARALTPGATDKLCGPVRVAFAPERVAALAAV